MVTIAQAMERILSQTGERLADTVDTLKCGLPDTPVRSIGVTFLVDTAVIEAAAQAGCNFIVTHEPTFYGHLDDVSRLADDPVYRHKQELLERHGIAVFRYHDHLHMRSPDIITQGVLRALGWESHAQIVQTPTGAQYSGLVTVPETTVGAIAAQIKDKLGEGPLHLVGEAQRTVHNVVLLPGASGFGWHRQAALAMPCDLMIAGEVNEWETPVWVADQRGSGPALLVIGHQRSEEVGMALCAQWLSELLPEVPVRFLPKAATYRTL